MVFVWNDLEYVAAYDGHTKKSGVSFNDVISEFFGEKCDKAKMDSLSKADKDGIASGQPAIGMSKDGILFAMGRPPVHVNSNLDARTWTYWANKFRRKVIEFDENGIVTKIQ